MFHLHIHEPTRSSQRMIKRAHSLAFVASIALLTSCSDMTSNMEEKVNMLINKTERLDSLVNKEIDKVLSLDSMINLEGDKVKKLDSLIDRSSSKLDSIANGNVGRLRNVLN